MEDTVTAFEKQTWLPDLTMGIKPVIRFSVWPVWEEMTRYLENIIMNISSLSIDRQLKLEWLLERNWQKKKSSEDWE